MLDTDDFSIGYEWEQDGDVLDVHHFYLDHPHRGEGYASFILETLVRVAYYEGAEVISVSMGGGESAEKFLRKNGFIIMKRRHYNPDDKDWEYGVDAVRRV